LWVKQKLRIGDSLDVFAVHGVGGMLGSLLLAVFALPALGGIGFVEGMTWTKQLGVQALAVAVTAGWTVVATWAIVKICGALGGLRVSAEAEYEGLDLSAHGERGYDFN
jgi:Amt family ammonium transporter